MTTPQFRDKPQFYLVMCFFTSLTLLYRIFGLFTVPEATAIGEIIFFLLPALWFFKKFGLVNSFSRQNLFLRGVVVTVGMGMLAYYFDLNVDGWIRRGPFPIPPEIEKLFDVHQFMHDKLRYGFVIDLTLLALLPAVCEEMLFRGILQNGLLQKMSQPSAILIAGTLFAAYHLNPWLFPFYVVLGILFGWIYIRTNSLPLAMLAHFVNNAVGVVLYYYG